MISTRWVLLALLLLGGSYSLDWGALPGGPKEGSSDRGESPAHGPRSGERILECSPRGDLPPPLASPSRLEAMLFLSRYGSIVIRGDSDFNPAHGFVRGSGTPSDPYTLERAYVDSLTISNTRASFRISSSWIEKLVLDWTGGGGVVQGNHIGSLEVNRNVPRTGEATAAWIVDNEIRKVDSIRHFDGIFARNVVGNPLLPTGDVLLNIAGFDGAVFAQNRIYGSVDMKIHGHHHSSTLCGPSHNHGTYEATLPPEKKENHSRRFIRLIFQDNLIESLGVPSLRYNDLAHAADDRTASSEPDPALLAPHRHFTEVSIVGNTIRGSTLKIQVFNAEDPLHLSSEGRILLQRNIVENSTLSDGIVLTSVRNATVLLHDNTVVRGKVRVGGEVGIRLSSFRNSTIDIVGARVLGFTYGVSAHDFDSRTTWRVVGGEWGDSKVPVFWDSTVANPPERT